MKTELKPNWSVEQQAAGEQFRQAWEESFAAAESGGQPAAARLLGGAGEPRIVAIQARHEAELLAYPNVIGVAEGIRMKRGKPTGEPALVVYVERKLPRAQLGKGGLLPREIEGVPIDVVEVGRVVALPR